MTDRGEAVVVGAEITAGHDGAADLVLSVRFENGVIAPVVLDSRTGFRLMEVQGAGDLSGLIGRPWRALLAQTVFGRGT